jgi:hypothetical protein
MSCLCTGRAAAPRAVHPHPAGVQAPGTGKPVMDATVHEIATGDAGSPAAAA